MNGYIILKLYDLNVIQIRIQCLILNNNIETIYKKILFYNHLIQLLPS